MSNVKKPTSEDVRLWISEECKGIEQLLLRKNEAYGNSALEPIGVFSGGDPSDQIRVRIDDKLKRLQNMRLLAEADVDVSKKVESDLYSEDTELDLIGYLVLLRVSRRWNARKWHVVSDAVEPGNAFTEGGDDSAKRDAYNRRYDHRDLDGLEKDLEHKHNDVAPGMAEAERCVRESLCITTPLRAAPEELSFPRVIHTRETDVDREEV